MPERNKTSLLIERFFPGYEPVPEEELLKWESIGWTFNQLLIPDGTFIWKNDGNLKFVHEIFKNPANQILRVSGELPDTGGIIQRLYLYLNPEDDAKYKLAERIAFRTSLSRIESLIA